MRAVALLVLAGVWVVAAWWLWQSVVPDDLDLDRYCRTIRDGVAASLPLPPGPTSQK